MSTIPALEAIAARRKEIRDEINRLQSEDSELLVAERVLNRLSMPAAPSSEESARPAKPVSTRDVILEYLLRTPGLWRTANEVQENVSEIKGVEVPMSSISPTLSDLKKHGAIVRDGLKVALASRVQREQPDFFNENGEAEASPDTGEPASSPNETPVASCD